jgi:hypothetical protein
MTMQAKQAAALAEYVAWAQKEEREGFDATARWLVEWALNHEVLTKRDRAELRRVRDVLLRRTLRDRLLAKWRPRPRIHPGWSVAATLARRAA